MWRLILNILDFSPLVSDYTWPKEFEVNLSHQERITCKEENNTATTTIPKTTPTSPLTSKTETYVTTSHHHHFLHTDLGDIEINTKQLMQKSTATYTNIYENHPNLPPQTTIHLTTNHHRELLHHHLQKKREQTNTKQTKTRTNKNRQQQQPQSTDAKTSERSRKGGADG